MHLTCASEHVNSLSRDYVTRYTTCMALLSMSNFPPPVTWPIKEGASPIYPVMCMMINIARHLNREQRQFI